MPSPVTSSNPAAIRLRHLPPVYTRIRARALVRAALDVASGRRAAAARTTAIRVLEARYPGYRAVLTDSGTSALALALRAASGSPAAPNPPLRVALPAYACPDVGTAVLQAGGRILLYDLDPDTLMLDLGSVEASLALGATHVVATHLFGRVVDVAQLRGVVEAAGAKVVEDAAQGAGGMLRGVRAGGLAEWGVLSFGRGKGLNCGGGGALLVRSRDTLPPSLAPSNAVASARALVLSSLTEMLAPPSVYWIPSSIPWIGLGETRFHAPHDPDAGARTLPPLLLEALAREPEELAIRRMHEAAYAESVRPNRGIATIAIPDDVESGALRYPVRARREQVSALAHLGVVRGYPRTLGAYPELAAIIDNPGHPMPGATELAATLHTLPTHRLLRTAERDAIVAALASAR